MKPEILSWDEIDRRLSRVDLVREVETAFQVYSEGRCVIPPVGELCFDDPPGDVHLKYGYVQGGTHYVVKIASGFYNNPALGLASSQGVMLLFEQSTGRLAGVLLDEGRLTDARTGAAGAVAAQHLAPSEVSRLGIVGTGTQARYQADYLRSVTSCRDLLIWGRDLERRNQCRDDLRDMGYQAEAIDSLEGLVRTSQIVVTTTPAHTPLIEESWVQPGTHITAVGSDTPQKVELQPSLLAKARVVVDSLAQSKTRGELFRAVSEGIALRAGPVELGAVVSGLAEGRRGAEEITIADLTGVAVQDLFAAVAVLRAGD